MPGTCLLIIDPQNDFHEGGSLGVPGAAADTARVAALLRAHGADVDKVVVTLDTHHKLHIAHGAFWTDAAGASPAPFTTVAAADVESGAWSPRDASKRDAALAYATALEAKGRFKICVWPEHCLIGTPGHAVVPELNAALQEWSAARLRPVDYVLKGMNCMTEMYSAISAEVEVPDDPSTATNTALVETLRGFDRVLCCGQALSHCVNFTVRDLVDGLGADAAAAKVVVLGDASSSVPGFEASGTAFVSDMEAKGVKVVKCEAAW